MAGWRDDLLLVRVNAPPVDGAANAELIKVIADALDVPRRAVSIVGRDTGRQKRIHIQGVDLAAVRRRLGALRV